MAGNDKKDSKYKARLLENISQGHPINNGILMQVHHLISESAIRKSGVGTFLKSVGYNINELHNLVALPSTLPGACHLEVQLHRGNHTQEIENEDDADSDRSHPKTYHNFIEKKLKDLVTGAKKECGDNFNALRKRTNEDVEELSEYILKRISNFTIDLTRVSSDYKPDNAGCRNTLRIPEQSVSEQSCSKPNRNHFGQLHQFSDSSKVVEIKYLKKKYTLEIGK